MDHDALVSLVDRAVARGAAPDVVARAQEEVSELFLAHEDRLYGLCLRFLGEPERALAHAVTSIRVAHRRLGEWRGEGPFWTWLYGVARDVCLRSLSRKRNLLTADGVLIPGSDAAKALAPMRREDWQELLRQVGLETLTAEEHEAVYLRYVEGLEVTEITEVLQAQGTGARGLLQRSRHKLGLALRGPPEPPRGGLYRHPRFSELAAVDVSDEVREHLAICPQCRVDRRRVRDPMAVRARDLEAVRPALAAARKEAGQTLVSSWRSAISGGPTRDDATRLEVLPYGTRLGPYRLTGLVERTGMAVSYRAHRGEQEPYLLKVLATKDPNVRSRLQREFRQLRGLRHPHVTEILDHLALDDCPVLVTEFVDGPTLEELLRHEVLLPLELVDTLAVHLLSGMAAAHAEGLVHRDLRTANVLIDVSGAQIEARVTGLGMARLLSVLEGGTSFGTPPYMAPEQLQDANRSDARSDVFALGAVLYELATGQRCFAAPDHVDAVRRVFALDYVPPGTLRDGLPERMEHAIAACLKADPDARPKSAAALLDLWTRGGGSAVRTGPTLTEGDVSAYRYLRRIGPLPDGGVQEAESVEEAPAEVVPASTQPRGSNVAAFIGVVAVLMVAAVGAFWTSLRLPSVSGPLFWPIARSIPLTVDPDVSPEGQRVVFTDHTNLYVLGLDAARPEVIPTGEAGPASTPAWAPDGRRIAFTARSGIWIVDERGLDLVYVAERGFDPTWSPGGERLAYVSAPTSDVGPLHPRRAGLSVVNLTNGVRRDLIPEEDAGPVDPAWAPNGIRIAWGSPSGIMVASTEGGKRVPLPAARAWHPVWLDDDTLLALCEPDEGRFAICRFDDGPEGWTEPSVWLTLDDKPRSFDVSAQSHRLVLELDRRTYAVLRLDPAGEVRRVPSGGEWPTMAAPAPSGQTLVAVDARRPGRLLSREQDGGWRTLIEVESAYAPSWRPDGSAITFSGRVAEGEEVQSGIFEMTPEGKELSLLSAPELDWVAAARWSAAGALAWTDRGLASASPVVVDVSRAWQEQLDINRAAPFVGQEAGAFSPAGDRLLVRLGERAWGIVEVETYVSLERVLQGVSAGWRSDSTVVTAEGTSLWEFDVDNLSETFRSEVDLTPLEGSGSSGDRARRFRGAVGVGLDGPRGAAAGGPGARLLRVAQGALGWPLGLS